MPAADRSVDGPLPIPGFGTVYGTVLNFRGALAALGDAVNHPPYAAPPRAPVLYLKPANTRLGTGHPIPVPDDVPALEMGGTLGIVIGRTACRVSESAALDHVAGYTVVNDVCVPHASLYRPAIRQRCRDGFCPATVLTPRSAVADPDRLALRIFVNGALRAENSTANLIRPVARLIADITAFLTLSAGDVLLVGIPENAPQAAAGDRVRIEIDGVGVLKNPLVSESILAEGAAP